MILKPEVYFYWPNIKATMDVLFLVKKYRPSFSKSHFSLEIYVNLLF